MSGISVQLTDADRLDPDGWIVRAESDLSAFALGGVSRAVETGSVCVLAARFEPGSARLTLYKQFGRARLEVSAGSAADAKRLASWIADTLETTVVGTATPA
ncbi:MAG TPA: hypothetical protein VGJ77_15780 [Gaiellaceae bacterium]|jgi:hypothetical protein